LFVSLVESLRALETLPDEELATSLARQYQEELTDYQHRMHSLPVGPLAPVENLPVLPRPSSPSPSSVLHSPADGYRALHAILDPVRDEICVGYRTHPDQFETPQKAVTTILRSLTRVDPPAPFLLTAAYLLWRQGLPGFCERDQALPGTGP
jgi:hypothetical protein